MAITKEQIINIFKREDLTDEEKIEQLNIMFAEDKADKRDLA